MYKILNIKENQKWDDAVKSFKHHDIYYYNGYAKCFELHGDGKPYLFLYEDDNFRALNVFIKRDISKISIFHNKIKENYAYDISTPYGYGGFLLEGDTSNIINLKNTYANYCIENNIVREFVRFHPLLENHKFLSDFYNLDFIGKTVTIDLMNKKMIWDNFDTKNRNMIRKAQNNNITIGYGKNEYLLNEFINLYEKTMLKDNARQYYYFKKEFYDNMLLNLSNEILFFYALYNKKIIAMSLILFTNKYMTYYLSCSNSDYQKLAPSNLMLYEIANWGSEKGYEYFHLGGGLGGKEDSLFKFKKVFNKNNSTYFMIGKKIYDMYRYNELFKIANINPNENLIW